MFLGAFSAASTMARTPARRAYVSVAGLAIIVSAIGYQALESVVVVLGFDAGLRLGSLGFAIVAAGLGFATPPFGQVIVGLVYAGAHGCQINGFLETCVKLALCCGVSRLDNHLSWDVTPKYNG